MKLYLADEIKPFLSDCPFKKVQELEGQTLRDKDGRRTFKTRIGNSNYFVKRHQGVGWKEIVKELSQLRTPVLTASNEFRAIRTLQKLGIDTTNAVGLGVRGLNPASIESFLITNAIEDAPTLAEITSAWNHSPPSKEFKRALIREVARIARIMHTNGINHRDFYLCHFRLSHESLQNRPRLYLMDLHRAQMRKKVPHRWKVKDLGALLFSAADIGLTQSDMFRFIASYSGRSPRQELKENEDLWQAVYLRARKFYEKDWKRPMPTISFGYRPQQ